jgi:hypothetical protein
MLFFLSLLLIATRYTILLPKEKEVHMKLLRKVFLGIAVLAMAICVSHVSFAQEKCHKGKENHEAKIKLLQDSAAALAKSNPELAQKISDYANEEAQEARDWKTKHEANVKLLKDASAALAQSNPDLAKQLQEISEGTHKKDVQGIKEKIEKEEPGETKEPKDEQNENKN